ncbi:hypothetical protein NIES37_60860 [Tolypothrix tenuis PCC 7101]|uniref:Uncharacterized protein n=1 Tax=Tolypothrix tenuis PCC 7101 TaxID=231146 RepID=A0A1Z4N8M1_9CYAN|nr:hypothetical protein [Aulosira sp. FACHB-113]BAZ02078.1 hypothetical protein NIES37_60860 [Tolypothrix tenuis PCC 7101]BAZ73999.1 hypothetical protein NIES50_25690 [Aulosira laxa NIES-50]
MVAKKYLNQVGMGRASKYWLLISINSVGKRCCDELTESKEFFLQQFPGFVEQENIPERDIQRQLMQLYSHDVNLQQLALGCLRCFISNEIKTICEALTQKFGQTHDFTIEEILPLVLDSHQIPFSQTQSLTTKILETFDPEKSNLSTWTNRILKSDRTVKQFLLEHGIEQVTDWMILNYTTAGNLARILSDYQHTQIEIDQALRLLDSYHQVYRTHLLQIRRTGAKSRYPEPTFEQLRQIGDLCQQITSPEEIREHLQNLARLLREERIRARRGLPRLELLADDIQIIVPQKYDQPSAFLADYQQKFDQCLFKSADLVIHARFEYLQGKNSIRSLKKAKKYIKALHLFHCGGVSMTEIASKLDLTDQPEVSRLLELKNLRNDIGRNTLSCLLKCVMEISQEYVTPYKLLDLESKIQAILEEEIQTVIEQARIDASTGAQQVIKNQLAQAICRYLCTRIEIRERT